MEENKPYLDPELSLQKLARQLGIQANALSRLINDGTGRNFNDFINVYRVQGYDEHASFWGTKKRKRCLVSHSIVVSTARLHLTVPLKGNRRLSPREDHHGGKRTIRTGARLEKWSHINEIVLSLILLNLY